MDAHSLARHCDQAFDVRAVSDIDSTNTRLMNEPFGTAPRRPQLLCADRQHAGRGRRGRRWVGDPAGSLMMSSAFERQVGADSLSMVGWPIAVGVAVAEALSDWVPDVRLKWPNDLQRAGRKCGGILVESRRQQVAGALAIERVVVGTGFNLHVDRPLRDAIDQPAIGLFDGLQDAVGDEPPLPSMPARELIAARIATGLLAAWQQFQAQGLASFIDRWATFDALAGQPVRIIENGQVLLEGLAGGVDRSGALRVLAPGGVQQVTVGDVSVRPVAPRLRSAGSGL